MSKLFIAASVLQILVAIGFVAFWYIGMEPKWFVSLLGGGMVIFCLMKAKDSKANGLDPVNRYFQAFLGLLVMIFGTSLPLLWAAGLILTAGHDIKREKE